MDLKSLEVPKRRLQVVKYKTLVSSHENSILYSHAKFLSLVHDSVSLEIFKSH